MSLFKGVGTHFCLLDFLRAVHLRKQFPQWLLNVSRCVIYTCGVFELSLCTIFICMGTFYLDI